MSLSEPIGGFFGLEPTVAAQNVPGGLYLNSARACFEYLLQALRPSRVFMPKYTCDVMMEPLAKLGVAYELYEVTDDFKIKDLPELGDGDYLVYTNYYGYMDVYCRELFERYGEKLLLDCAQAYYFEPLAGGHTFYSPRKYFGLPDGGILQSSVTLEAELPVDDSANRMSHLHKRLELGAEAAYEDFQKNDASLSGEPIKQMSPQTRELLTHIDTEAARQKRRANFRYLHEHLKAEDRSSVELADIACPMAYLITARDAGLRARLTANKIFVPTYWPNVLESNHSGESEYQLAQNSIPLPIDQRYDEQHMAEIIEVLYADHT